MAGGKKEDKNKIMQDKLEAHETKFKELEELITTQKETIQGLKDQQVQLEQDAQAAKVRVFYVQVFGIKRDRVQSTKCATMREIRSVCKLEIVCNYAGDPKCASCRDRVQSTQANMGRGGVKMYVNGCKLRTL